MPWWGLNKPPLGLGRQQGFEAGGVVQGALVGVEQAPSRLGFGGWGFLSPKLNPKPQIFFNFEP